MQPSSHPSPSQPSRAAAILLQPVVQLLYFLLLLLLPFLLMAVPLLAHAQEAGVSYRVSVADAEAAIAQTLQEEGLGEKVKVLLATQGLRTPLATYQKDVKVYVEQLQLDKTHQKFTSTLVFEADGKAMAPLTVSGHYEPTQALPVLNRAVRNGQVIGEDDIAMRDVPQDRIRKNTVTDKGQIVGKTALRTISPNRMIRTDELIAPAVISKGQPVTIRFLAKNLEIKGVGEAQEDGAIGSMIRVKNRDSKQIVQGIVEDEHTVAIYGNGGVPVAPKVAPAKAAITAPTAAPFVPTHPPALSRQAPVTTSAQPIAQQATLPNLPATIPDQDAGSADAQEVGDAPADAPTPSKTTLTDPIDVLEKSHAQR